MSPDTLIHQLLIIWIRTWSSMISCLALRDEYKSNKMVLTPILTTPTGAKASYVLWSAMCLYHTPIFTIILRKTSIKLVIMPTVDDEKGYKNCQPLAAPESCTLAMFPGVVRQETDSPTHNGAVPSSRSYQMHHRGHHVSLTVDDRSCTRRETNSLRNSGDAQEANTIFDGMNDRHRPPTLIEYPAISPEERRDMMKTDRGEYIPRNGHLRANEPTITPLELPPSVLPVSEMTAHQAGPYVSERDFDRAYLRHYCRHCS
ncbi:unnamed protein product [Peniophora sp. CBMAI 1063]|nr:unnamed protein product [Peniophora sp. CBMAI 1063]